MCKLPATSASSGAMPSIFNAVITISITLYTLGFIFFRIAELVPLAIDYPHQSLSVIIGTLVIQFSSIGRTPKRIVYLSTLLGTIYLIDYWVPNPLPPPSDEYTGKTIVITGANSGVGRETARQLAVNYGMNVILGCRSKSKCDAAAKAINDEVESAISGSQSQARAIPMTLDLSSFQSVISFASQLSSRKIDYLFNNAGYVPNENEPLNQYGLDPSFTTMHLSHFLLTEELLKTNNPSLRVINTSSGTHHICALPFAIIPQYILDAFPPVHNPGCVDGDYLKRGIYTPPDQSAYIIAKVANVMHAVEMPRHYGQATAVAIDLGWVGTHIQSFMEGVLTPTNLGWMRSVHVGVLPVMHAILSSDEELLKGSKNLKEGRMWKVDGGIVMNVFGRAGEAFSFKVFWKEEVNLGRRDMLELSRGLWDASLGLIEKNIPTE